VNLDHNCDRPVNSWFRFDTRIDPNEIYLPVPEQPIDIDQQKIFSGVYMYYDSVHVYPAFLSANKSYSDIPVVTSHGFLYFDKAADLYKIGSKDMIHNFMLAEDYLSFHREECKLRGEGKVDLGQDLGQVKMSAYGIVHHDIPENETTVDIALMMDFFMDDEMIKLMAHEIDSAPDLTPVDLNRSVWKKTLNRTIGETRAQELSDELNLFGTIKELPEELRHTLILSELNLKWNDVRNSWQSEGPIGIASIDDVQINKKVNGYLELQIKRSGDILDFYLEIDDRTYYYFGYTRGVMQTLSSNPVYVETIMNMKTKDRKMRVRRNETSYIYMVSTDRKKNNFYRRYRDAIEGINSEEDPENME
jgi:hypothetical protein